MNVEQRKNSSAGVVRKMKPSDTPLSKNPALCKARLVVAMRLVVKMADCGLTYMHVRREYGTEKKFKCSCRKESKSFQIAIVGRVKNICAT